MRKRLTDEVEEHKEEYMHMKWGTFWGLITIPFPIFMFASVFKLGSLIESGFLWYHWGSGLIVVFFLFLIILWIPIVKNICGDC